jgi:hypothetical protein
MSKDFATLLLLVVVATLASHANAACRRDPERKDCEGLKNEPTKYNECMCLNGYYFTICPGVCPLANYLFLQRDFETALV